MKSVAAALIFLSYSLQLISTQLITNFFLFYVCVCDVFAVHLNFL